MQDVLSRRESVRRIAIRAGWPEQSAEDLGQEAALQLIANPNRRTQTASQAYVDAVRSSGEGFYRRSGGITQPLYESAFEDFAHFIDGTRSHDDLEGRTIARSDLHDVVLGLETLRPNWRLALEMYADGSTLVEISQRLGCSESRVSQLVKFSRIQLKEAIISSGISRQKQRKRKWTESQAIPRPVQERSRVQRILSFAMEAFRVQTVEGLVSFKVPKVPQTLFTSF